MLLVNGAACCDGLAGRKCRTTTSRGPDHPGRETGEPRRRGSKLACKLLNKVDQTLFVARGRNQMRVELSGWYPVRGCADGVERVVCDQKDDRKRGTLAAESTGELHHVAARQVAVANKNVRRALTAYPDDVAAARHNRDFKARDFKGIAETRCD